MQDAIQNGLVGNNNALSQVAGFCPSANCTWEPYTSLAFCSTVEDVTSSILKECGTTDLDERELYSCNVTTKELRAGYMAEDPAANPTLYFDAFLNLPSQQFGVFSTYRVHIPNNSLSYQSPPLRNPHHNFAILDVFLIYMKNATDFPSLRGLYALKGTISLCLQTLETTMINGTTKTVVRDNPNVTWTGSINEMSRGTYWTQIGGRDLNYTVDYESIWVTAFFLLHDVFHGIASPMTLPGLIIPFGDGDETQFSEILNSLGTAIFGPGLNALDQELSLEGFMNRMNNVTSSMTNAYVKYQFYHVISALS